MGIKLVPASAENNFEVHSLSLLLQLLTRLGREQIVYAHVPFFFAGCWYISRVVFWNSALWFFCAISCLSIVSSILVPYHITSIVKWQKGEREWFERPFVRYHLIVGRALIDCLASFLVSYSKLTAGYGLELPTSLPSKQRQESWCCSKQLRQTLACLSKNQ